MADFTPTTAQVRSGYACDPEGEYRDPINAASNQRWAERAFDRWLDAVKREAKAAAWDACVASMVYEDGSPVEIVTLSNPYRKESPR